MPINESAQNVPDSEIVWDIPDDDIVWDEAPTEQPPAAPDSFGDDVLDVTGEFAASANRGLAEFIDLLAKSGNMSVGGYNGILKLLTTGSLDEAVKATQVQPIPQDLTGALEGTGIRGGFMDPGTPRDAVQAAGLLSTVAGGMKSVPRVLDSSASIAAEIMGAGSQAAAPVKALAPIVADKVPNVLPSVRQAKQAAELPLKRQSGDVATAGFKLDEAGNVVRDAAQKEALRQGFDEGIVGMISAAPKAFKAKARKMVDIAQRGRENALYRQKNRPQTVLGDSILDRIKVVDSVREEAGDQLDNVARSLRGKRADPTPATMKFIGDLEEKLGVKFDPVTGKTDFSQSKLKGLKGPQKTLNTILGWMRDFKNKTPDAHDLHWLKGFIDEQVQYGKSKRGVSGTLDRLTKRLRRDINGILGDTFPEYKAVNTQYSEAKTALDEIQNAVGKRIDFDSPTAASAMGTIGRRLAGNQVSRQGIEDAITLLDTVAQKYNTPMGVKLVKSGTKAPLRVNLDDGINEQVQFVTELERMFKTTVPPASFEGGIGKAGEKVVKEFVDTQKGPIRKVMGAAAKKAATMMPGVSEDEAIAALRELLKD